MMKKISKALTVFLICLCMGTDGLPQNISGMFMPKMTAVNTRSYTDVQYVGLIDTVIVSTYSGKISEINRTSKNEKVIAQLNDEVYVLAYNPKQKHIAASTLESGILIVDRIQKRIVKKLPLIQTWSLRLSYSADYKILFANDQRGNRFMWDVLNGYKTIEISKDMPQGTIVSISDNFIHIATGKKVYKWDMKAQTIIEEFNVNLSKLTDFNGNGNILSISFNKCDLISLGQSNSLFSFMHPSWLRPVESLGGEDAARTAGFKVENGYFADTAFQMALTDAKFSNNKIFTSGIDRSIRIWDMTTGNLSKSFTGHNATVNKIEVSPNQKQLVSIDLKGTVKFWEID